MITIIEESVHRALVDLRFLEPLLAVCLSVPLVVILSPGIFSMLGRVIHVRASQEFPLQPLVLQQLLRHISVRLVCRCEGQAHGTWPGVFKRLVSPSSGERVLRSPRTTTGLPSSVSSLHRLEISSHSPRREEELRGVTARNVRQGLMPHYGH